MTIGPWQTDHTSDYFAAWLATHPMSPLKDWEQRARDRAFEVEPPEVDEDTQRGDMADWESARRYGR